MLAACKVKVTKKLDTDLVGHIRLRILVALHKFTIGILVLRFL